MLLLQELWAFSLENIRDKLHDIWIPKMVLGSIINVKTLEATAPRCSVCTIGFVRVKQSKSKSEAGTAATSASNQPTDGDEMYGEHNLCLPCLMRRDLYDLLKSALPRSFRRSEASIWPFKSNEAAALLPPPAALTLTLPKSFRSAAGLGEDSDDANVSSGHLSFLGTGTLPSIATASPPPSPSSSTYAATGSSAVAVIKSTQKGTPANKSVPSPSKNSTVATLARSSSRPATSPPPRASSSSSTLGNRSTSPTVLLKAASTPASGRTTSSPKSDRRAVSSPTADHRATSPGAKVGKSALLGAAVGGKKPVEEVDALPVPKPTVTTLTVDIASGGAGIDQLLELTAEVKRVSSLPTNVAGFSIPQEGPTTSLNDSLRDHTQSPSRRRRNRRINEGNSENDDLALADAKTEIAAKVNLLGKSVVASQALIEVDVAEKLTSLIKASESKSDENSSQEDESSIQSKKPKQSVGVAFMAKFRAKFAPKKKVVELSVEGKPVSKYDLVITPEDDEIEIPKREFHFDKNVPTVASLAQTKKSGVISLPGELALLPMLVATGNYDETERTIRICIKDRQINDGDGLLLLTKMLGMQAEMYKYMGLWPLALALLLDCADLMVGLLGFRDRKSIIALGEVRKLV